MLNLTVDRRPTAEAIAAMREQWRATRVTGLECEARPFLLATPLGLARRDDLAKALVEARVDVVDRHSLPAWSLVSTLVYARTDDDVRLRAAAVYTEAWHSLSLPDTCERWDLRTLDDLERLRVEKPALRAAFGSVRVTVTVTGANGVLPAGLPLRLNPFHTPDPERLQLESAILDHLAT